MEQTVTVFNLQRFSLHDGPGIRTVVFFKGCPLRCPWCSNPESQRCQPDLLYEQRLCLRCGHCVERCPASALYWDGDGKLQYRPNLCRHCFQCAQECMPRALQISGREYPIHELVGELKREAIFHRRQGGGVTLSGGEPLAQPQGTQALLAACKAANLHTAIETCCHVPASAVESCLPYLDYCFCDIKHIDSARHQALTRVGNERILDNILRILHSGKELVLRYPLIPGQNDDPQALEGLGAWLAVHCPGVPLELMAYHRYGLAKYDMLWRPYTLEGVLAPEDDQVERALTLLRAHGVPCRRG